MKIVLTGSNGFIGSYVFNALKNNNIIGIDISQNHKKNTHYVDITEAEKLEYFIKKNKDIDIIIHAAALAHKKGTDQSFETFKKINFYGTKNLIDLSNKYLNLKRFIFFSTISVYGEQLNINNYREDDECNCKTPYAITKKLSEEYIKNYSKFNYTILRFAPVYHKNFTLNIDRRTIIKNHIYIVGTGKNKLSLLSVKNIIEVINYLLNNQKKCINEIFNIADSETYTFNDLIEINSKITGKKLKIFFPEFVFYMVYIFGKLISNNFLTENSIKLLSDNIYDTSKISHFIAFKHNLYESFK